MMGKPLIYCLGYKSVCKLLNKLKVVLPYNLAIPFWGIYLKEPKVACYRDTCILMLL